MNKATRYKIIADIIFLLGALLVMIAFMSCSQSPNEVTKKSEKKTRPIFAEGDCITFSDPQEHWEPIIISKIMEVGTRNYRHRYYESDSKEFIELDWTLSFSSSDMYKQIECPK